MILRDYQHKMLHDARQSLAHHKRILLVGPTGCGKTNLALAMISSAIARGKRVLFLCHRRELVRQSSRRFWEAGVPHGMVMAGRAMTDVPANVGVINTVVNRIDRMRAPDLIIIDEAHRSVSPSYLEIFAAWPDAHVVGLTATPERTDGKGLGQIYDAIVEGPSMRQLINAGYLCDYEIIAPASSVVLTGVDMRAGDYASDQLAAAVDKSTITGDAVAAYKQYANGKRCMVFCVTIEHSQHVCEQYNASGIPAEHIDGEHSDTERDEILGRFRRGETLVVCSVQLAIEGLDIPAIEAVQGLRPTASVIVYLQTIGRGLRAEPGKPRLIILDQVANWSRHGLPDDTREWSLNGRVKNKRGEKNETTLTVKQCGQCYAVFRIGPSDCPSCGAPIPGGGRDAPETVDAPLVKIDIEQMRLAQKREQGTARTLSDLVALGIRRGMKKPAEWAATVNAARQGRRPTPAEFMQARECANQI